jgi:hypothetical protein
MDFMDQIDFISFYKFCLNALHIFQEVFHQLHYLIEKLNCVDHYFVVIKLNRDKLHPYCPCLYSKKYLNNFLILNKGLHNICLSFL